MAPSISSKQDGTIKPLMTLLKEETFEYHRKLESLSFFGQLINHTLPLDSYVNQLKGLSIIHSVMENELASSKDQIVTKVWDENLRKLKYLEEDIAFFAPRVPSENRSPIESALALADSIMRSAVDNPISLLGYLYVFEGSTLGNNMHQPDVSACFSLPGIEGCRYFYNYGNDLNNHWKQFSNRMNIIDNEENQQSILKSAHDAFAGLELFYNKLYPLDKENSFRHITRINPEAGNHPIPEDEREIEAALKASDRCWNEFPYYQLRYSDRGKRFSDSDNCWLATLPDLKQHDLNKQIKWLCHVLATRGMPSVMMESNLNFLAHELKSAVPEKSDFYKKLELASEALKSSRMSLIDSSKTQKLTEEFGKQAEVAADKRFKNMGLLLVSAVVDEKSGMPGTLSALRDWLVQSDMFSEQGIKAIDTLIETANQI